MSFSVLFTLLGTAMATTEFAGTDELYTAGCYDQDTRTYTGATLPGRWNIANDVLSALEPNGVSYEELEANGAAWGELTLGGEEPAEYQTCSDLLDYLNIPAVGGAACDTQIQDWNEDFGTYFTNTHIANLEAILTGKYPVPGVIRTSTLRTICCLECYERIPLSCSNVTMEFAVAGGEDTKVGDWYPYACEKGSSATHNRIACTVVDGQAVWDAEPACEQNGYILYIVLGVLGLLFLSLATWVLCKCMAAIKQKNDSLSAAQSS